MIDFLCFVLTYALQKRGTRFMISSRCHSNVNVNNNNWQILEENGSLLVLTRGIKLAIICFWIQSSIDYNGIFLQKTCQQWQNAWRSEDSNHNFRISLFADYSEYYAGSSHSPASLRCRLPWTMFDQLQHSHLSDRLRGFWDFCYRLGTVHSKPSPLLLANKVYRLR